MKIGAHKASSKAGILLRSTLILFCLLLCNSRYTFAANITPIRTDVAGFSSWTDVNIAGTTYLQMLTSTSSTITPSMDFSTYNSITLDFSARTFGGVNAAKNVITISVSTDGGSTWSVIGTRTPTSATLSAQTQISLSYTSATTKIKFQTLGAGSSIGSGIDNITISGTAISSSPTITLASNTVSASNNCASSTKVPIQSFSLAVTGAAGNLTNVGFTTSGTYVQADITKYQLWYGSSNSIGSATQLGSDLTSSGGAGARTFSAFTSPTLTISTTYYFWITADLTSGAVNGNTIAVNAITTSDLTSTSTKAGSTSASGSQTLKAAPTSSAGSAQTVCSTATLAATNPTIGTGVWSLVSGTGTITTSSAYNSGLTDLGVGANVFRWTVSNSPCAAATSDVTITANTTPAAPTASAQSFCSSSSPTVANLQATGTSIQWYAASSLGSALDGGTALVNSTTYYATQTVGGCESASRTSVLVTVNSPIVISASPSNSPVSTCLNGTAFSALTVTANGTTYQWYSNTTSSTSGGTPVGTNSNSYIPVNTSAGTLYYYCVVSNGEPCSSSVASSVSGAVTVNALPANPSTPTSDSPQCASPGVTLTSSGSAPVGETWYWQTTTTGTSTSNSANTYNTSTAGTYYIRSKNTTSGCWSSGYGSATIAINSVPSAPSSITGSSSICASSTGNSYSVTNVSGNTYNWTLPSGWAQTAGGTSNSISVTGGNSSGSISVTTTNACGTSSASNLAVTVIALPTASASNGGSYCHGNDIQLTSGGSDYVSYSWSGPNSYSASGTNGTSVTQNFDGLNTGTSWSDNSTLPGWYILGGQGNTSSPATAISTLTVGTGTGTSGQIYNLSSSSISSDRALGSLASGSYSNSGYTAFYYGIKVTNTTGGPITSVAITYTGEQYRDAGNASLVAQSLLVDYSTNATALTTASGSWVSIPELTFTSPIYTSTAGLLNGNSAANRVANITKTLTGLNIANNSSIWIRWADLNDSGNDHALAIDDVTISLFPNTAINTISNASSSNQGVYTLSTTNNSGCSASATTTVTVNNPSIPVGVTLASGDVIWTGATSVEYGLASNWLTYNGSSYSAGSIPSVETNVIIPASGSTCVINDPSTSTTIYAKDVKISGVFSLNSGATINLSGNWTNNGTFTANSASSVVFIGSAAQTISGSSNSTFGNLTINNAAGLNISKGITVNNVLTFTSGNVIAESASEALTFETTGSFSGATDSKCIVGYCKKNTNSTDKFTFPVGTNSLYRFASITPSISSATTWTVKYFGVGYGDYTVTGSNLNHPSQREYWAIDRSGSSSATIQLSWGSNSNVDADYSDLAVVHYDGSNWETAGGNNIIGTINSGVVSSNSDWSYFSPFTLGSVNGSVPLPIQLIKFEAKSSSDKVIIQWETAVEMDNDYFIVERSFDGVHFSPITRVNGAGNSTHLIHYSTEDQQYANGINYYRLIQSDFNGKETISKIEAVDMTRRIGIVLKVINSLGQEVNENYSGIVFDVMNDGTLVKRFQ